MASNLVPPKLDGALQRASGGLPAPPEDLSATLFEPSEPGVQWGRHFAALKRYKWLILLVTIVGTAIGIVATRFIEPVYTVQATLWVEPGPAREGPIRASGLLEDAGWIELLTTRAVLEPVVEEAKLYLQPAKIADSLAFKNFELAANFQPGDYVLQIDESGKGYALATQGGQIIESGRVGAPIGRKVGFVWQPAAVTPGRAIEFAVVPTADAVDELGKQLTAQMTKQGNFLRLTLTGSDPDRLVKTLNTLTTQFVSIAAELKKARLKETSNELEKQMASMGAQLKSAEQRLESFKIQTITKPTESTPIAPGLEQTNPTVIGSYFNQKLRVEELKHDREALLSVLDRTRAGDLAVDAYQTIPSVRTATDLQKALGELSAAEIELRTLQGKYTDEYKPVKTIKEHIEALRSRTIPAYTQALVSALAKQEADLTGRIGTASRELQEIPARVITEQRLTREVQSIAGLYADVQGRYQSARLAEASAVPDLRTLDTAIRPDKPSSSGALQIIVFAFGISMALSIGLALLLDRLDRRFRYPDQVTRELGLGILGAIPAIKKARPSERDPDEASQVVEAFRTVRMNLAHSYGAAGPVLLTVSSPSPGDGKSLVSSNLALSFAEAGYRTVLVDGDIRRGELHRMFNAERRPGLLDHLAGTTGTEEILRPSSHKNLTLIPCGTRFHHGPELLGSVAMRELIANLKAHFNVVIVDSPPLGAGIDPFVLGTATGNIMLVLRSGETDRQMAEAKLRLLDRLPVRILGAVLNDIQAVGVYRYYGYTYGYTADEERMPELAGQTMSAREA